MELRYIRDTDKREIDFVVLKNEKPIFAVESRIKGTSMPGSIQYFSTRLKIPQFYFVHLGEKDYEHATLPVRVLPFSSFVKECNMP